MGKSYERQQWLLFSGADCIPFIPQEPRVLGGGAVGKGVPLGTTSDSPALIQAFALQPALSNTRLSPAHHVMVLFEIQMRSQCLQEASWPLLPLDLSKHIISCFFFSLFNLF